MISKIPLQVLWHISYRRIFSCRAPLMLALILTIFNITDKGQICNYTLAITTLLFGNLLLFYEIDSNLKEDYKDGLLEWFLGNNGEIGEYILVKFFSYFLIIASGLLLITFVFLANIDFFKACLFIIANSLNYVSSIFLAILISLGWLTLKQFSNIGFFIFPILLPGILLNLSIFNSNESKAIMLIFAITLLNIGNCLWLSKKIVNDLF